MLSEYEEQAKIFKAFCDEKRLQVLELLKGGEKCACVLVESLGIPQSSLSYHMKILCDSGIVESREDGKWTHYSISKKRGAYVLELLKKIVDVNDEPS